MPKFIPYLSSSSYLAQKFRPFAQLRSWYFEHNKFDSELILFARDPRSKRSPYFLGGLNPLLAMKKDFVDTFKPYKSDYYILRDLIQPLRGVGNIISGLFNIVLAPVIFLANIPRYGLMAIKAKNFKVFTATFMAGSIKNAGGFLGGISSVIRGVTQVVTTPLTWFLRMPLRGLITAIKGKPTVCQNLEKRAEELAGKIRGADKTVEDAIAIDREMQSMIVKIAKARKRGQEIGSDYDTIFRKFDLCQQFADKKLNGGGALSLRLFGATTNEGYSYCPDTSEYPKRNALAFLGMFKTKTTGALSEETILEAENEYEQEADSMTQRWNHISERSYI